MNFPKFHELKAGDIYQLIDNPEEGYFIKIREGNVSISNLWNCMSLDTYELYQVRMDKQVIKLGRFDFTKYPEIFQLEVKYESSQNG